MKHICTLLILLSFSSCVHGEEGWTERESWVTKHVQEKKSDKEITGLVLPQGWEKAAPWDDRPVQTALPQSFTWTDFVKLPAVRNQGGCGSCWIFSVTGVVEALHRILYPMLFPVVDMSEQHGLSCSGKGTCGGGYFTAFDFARDNGIAPEADFPYAGRDLRCKSGLVPMARITAWKYVGSSRSGGTIEQIKQAILDHGPVSVDINGTAIQRYGSGVYTACGSTSTNHMVVLYGWKDDPAYAKYGGGYWLMRNSWGTSWGEEGNMRIVYQSSGGSKCAGVAGITAYAEMNSIDNIAKCTGCMLQSLHQILWPHFHIRASLWSPISTR